MLDDAGLVDLMRSIAAQGFFTGEPILVARSVADNQKYVVVEGNRRFAASLLLANPNLAPTSKLAVKGVADQARVDADPSLPALVFPDYDSILKHLGYRHVTGVKEWEPLAKARFLLERFEKLEGSLEDRFRQVARTIGSRSDYVGRLLTALKLYEMWREDNFFGMQGVDEARVEFSLLSSALAYKSIYDFVGLKNSYDFEMANLRDVDLHLLLSLLYEEDQSGLTRLRESRNLGRLSRLFNHASAIAALREGSTLSEAESTTGDGVLILGQALSKISAQFLSIEEKWGPGIVVSQADLDALDRIAVQIRSVGENLQAILDETVK